MVSKGKKPTSPIKKTIEKPRGKGVSLRAETVIDAAQPLHIAKDIPANQFNHPANQSVEALSWTDQLRLRVMLEELAQRDLAPAIDLATAFVLAATEPNPWQRSFIYDNHTHKAIFGERRGGKTTLMAISAIEQCLRVPYSKVMYIGLTQGSVRKAMYDEILPMLIRNHAIPAHLVGADSMRFDNGSIVYLIGVDATDKQKERVRGTKSSLTIVDECQSYTHDIGLIIKDILGPTAADTKAKTILGGTAGNSMGENYWYQITRDNTKDNPISQSVLHPEYMVYRCAWKDNAAIDEGTGRRICDNVREYLTSQIVLHPGIDMTEGWRQEWNAEWIVSTSALIYRYTEANYLMSPMCLDLVTNQRIPLPNPPFWQSAGYILGLDLGYNDSTAMCVLAYNQLFSDRMYVIEVFHQAEMLVPEVASKISSLNKLYHFDHMVGDSSSLQVFETMRQTYSLPIEKANRAGKLSHQLVLNSDLQTRTIVFMPGTEELIKQLSTCIWEAKALKEGKHVEDPKYKNDLSDSFLYAHNFSRHLWYQPKQPKKPFTNKEHEERLVEQLINKNREDQEYVDYAEPNLEWIMR